MQTWSFAQDACESKNANLVTINSAAKQTEINSLVGWGYIWIGYRLVNGDFQWVSGAKKSYFNWGRPEPNNLSGEACVQSQHSPIYSGWHHINCNGALAQSFVCETTSLSGNNN